MERRTGRQRMQRDSGCSVLRQLSRQAHTHTHTERERETYTDRHTEGRLLIDSSHHSEMTSSDHETAVTVETPVHIMTRY